MNSYLIHILIFVFACSVQTQSDTTGINVPFSSTMVTSIVNSVTSLPSTVMDGSFPSNPTSPGTSNPSGATDSLSVTSLPSTVMDGSFPSNPTSPGTSNPSGGTGSLSVTSPTTINSSTYVTSMGMNASTAHVTSSLITTSSSSATSQPITSPIQTRVYLTYQYLIQSLSPVMTGNITNATLLASVQAIIASSFNQSNFIITVIRIEIRARAKISNQEMLTYNLFESSRNDCNVTCIMNALSSSIPTRNISLPTDNGSLVLVSFTSGATLVNDIPPPTTTIAPINYQKGDSPPGVSAQLGMGLGITFITLLIIGEIIFLYRKYGWNGPSRRPNYELPAYNNRFE